MPALLGKQFPIKLSHRLPLVMAIVLCIGIAFSPHTQTADKQQEFESLLKRFPDADADKDGKLTLE
jgi:hypothetical protein